ncbi:MAG: hypothetical protein U0R24_15120 [Solirubrobacterales bacterium]
MGDGLLAGGDLAAPLRRGELTDGLAERRAGFDPGFGGDLVAAQERLGGAVELPRHSEGEHLRGELEVTLDRPLGDPSALSREAIGDGQQRRLDDLVPAAVEIAVHAPRRQRPVLDHEPEHEVVAGHRGDLAREGARTAQAPEQVGHHACSDLVVALEGDPALRALDARRGLADVVQECSEAQRAAARQPVGERLREDRRDPVGGVAREAREIRLDLEQPAQDLDRVPVGIEVVVGALADAAQRVELGQDPAERPELGEQLDASDRIGSRHERPQLRELPLPGRFAGAAGARAGERQGSLLDEEAERRREPGGAQQPQGIVLEGAGRDGSQQARLEIGEPAGGVDRRSTSERHGDGVDGEVTQSEVGFDVRPAKGGDVDGPIPLPRRDAPCLELRRELERVPVGRPGDGASGGLDVARERQVDVGHALAAHGVADGAADDPRIGIRSEPRAGGADSLRGRECVGDRAQRR